MESPLKQRLIGAAVLAALAIIFLPMLLKGPAVREPDAAEVPLSMPAAPGDAFETRELPLTAPEAIASTDGVLGMKPGAAGVAPSRPDAEPPAVEEALAEEPVVASAPEPAAPAVAPPAAPAETDARVAAGSHVLTVGTFANAASASALAARLRAAGLPVLSERVTIASGPATRVRVGPFGSRAAAEAARQRVEQIIGTPSRAVVLDRSPAAGAAPAAKLAEPASPPAQASTATPAPEPRPAPATSGFAVQLSAPSVEADANALRDRARAAGFASFVQRVDTPTGARFRVRIGPVTDRGAANELLAEAKARLGLTGIVVSAP